jgi:hypothetical protein
MNFDQVEIMLEELQVPAEKIHEIMLGLSVIEKAPQEEGASSVSEEEIKIQIQNEPDWRKRASLAALLISKNL